MNLRRLALPFVGLLAAAALISLAEGALRVWRAAHPIDRTYVRDPLLGWTGVPGLNKLGSRMDARGFPIIEGTAVKKPDARRVLFTGDSIFFGYKTSNLNAQSFPAAVQAAANAVEPGRIEAQTLSMVAYRAFQVDLALREYLDELDPDVVVISVGWNDLLDGLFDPWSEDWILKEFHGMPVGLRRAVRPFYRLQIVQELSEWLKSRGPGGEPGRRYAPELADRTLDVYRARMSGLLDYLNQRSVPVVLWTLPCVLDDPPTDDQIDLATAEIRGWDNWATLRLDAAENRMALSAVLIRQVERFNGAIREFAARPGVMVFDSNFAARAAPGLFSSHCHLTPAGSRAVADHFYRDVLTFVPAQPKS